MIRVSRRALLAIGALALAVALGWAYQEGKLPGFAAKDQGPARRVPAVRAATVSLR